MAKKNEEEETPQEKAMRLRQEAHEAEQEAISELLEKRKELDDALAALGYQEGSQTKSSNGTGVKRPRDLTRPCPVCNIPGHDKRAHRSHPEPFTAAELKERGFPQAA